MRHLLLPLFAISFLVIQLLGNAGCANIIPPSGGPRDSIPPVLISATPPDSTVNFRGDRIVFTFDEYIDLQDLSNNVLFTPTFEINPEIAERGRTVTVRFRDTLSSNTTYILNFGNAIKDINESNVLRNFVYTFSTGPSLDSLTLSGKVVLAETGRVDSSLIVMLHRDLSDSAVINRRPTYITRLDGSGNFTFKNLPAGRFKIYALGDAGMNRRYQNKNQYFAFVNDPVLPGTTGEITLHAYRETAPTTTTNTGRIPAVERRLIFSSNLSANQKDLVNDLVLTFATPLRSFDSTKLALSTDSAFIRVPYSASLDASGKELRLRSQWKQGTLYNLILDRDFAEDTAGRKLLKTDTLRFTTRKVSDYADLKLRFRNIDTTKNPVLQFVQNNQVVHAASVRNGLFTAKLFYPGEYSLQILYDTNNNGKWDAGEFFGIKRQPELVIPIERKITVRPGAENDFEVSL